MDFSNLDIAMNHEEAHRCELLFEVIWNDINKSKATYFGRRVGVSSYAQYSEKEDSTECRPNRRDSQTIVDHEAQSFHGRTTKFDFLLLKSKNLYEKKKQNT